MSTEQSLVKDKLLMHSITVWESFKLSAYLALDTEKSFICEPHQMIFKLGLLQQHKDAFFLNLVLDSPQFR